MTRFRHICLLPLLLIFVGGIIGGCSRQRFGKEMEQARQVLDTYPDSALNILKSIDIGSAASVAETAEYAVLLARATNYCGLPETNDSLLSIADEYYSSHGHKDEELDAKYYLGVALCNNGKLHKSAEVLLEGSDLANNLKDNYYAGLMCQELAEVYQAFSNPAQAIRYYDLAKKYYLLANNSEYATWIDYRKARSYLDDNQPDRSIEIFDRVLQSSTEKRDTGMMAYTLSNLAVAEMITKDFDAARTHLNLLGSLGNGQYMRGKDWRNLTMTYLRLDSLQQALAAKQRIDSADVIGDALISYEISRLQGDYHSASQQLSRAYELQDSLSHYQRPAVAAKESEQFYLHQLNSREQRLKRFRDINVGATILLILGVIAIGLYYRHNRKIIRSRRQEFLQLKKENGDAVAAIKRLERKTQRLNETIAERDRDLERAKSRMRKEAYARFEIIDHLSLNFDTPENATLVTYKEAYRKVEKLLASFYAVKKNFEKVEFMINRTFDNVMRDFRADFPDMRDDALQVFGYTVLGFSPRSIALFIARTPNSVYKIRKELKDKITAAGGKTAQKYADFIA